MSPRRPAKMPNKIVMLKINSLRVDRSVSARTSLSEEVIESYREVMERKESQERFPPIVAFSDGETCWLADGFLRHEAARRAGHKYIETDIREGGYRQARLFAASANQKHGARRTPADVRLAV